MKRLSTRMIGALCALFALNLVVGVLSWWALDEKTETLRHTYVDHMVPLRNLKVISDRYAVNVVDAAHKARSGMFSMKEANKEVREAVAEIDKLWKEYKASKLKVSEQELATKADDLLKKSREAAEIVAQLTAANDRIKLVEFIELKLYAMIDPGTEAIGALIDFHLRETREHYEVSSAAQVRTHAILAVLGALTMLLSAGAALYIAFGVAKPLRASISTMNRLADGDLDVEISGAKRGDEIGEMARALTNFREGAIERRAMQMKVEEDNRERLTRAAAIEKTIQDFEAATLGIVATVASAAAELENSANSMKDVTQAASEQATTVAAASHEASESIQALAGNTNELAASIHEIGRQAEQSSAYASAAANKAQETDRASKRLAEAGNKIVEVVEIIKSIASQTNLLALNATIEAARAGESGRGFAVVAAEVKVLATQTTKALDVIAEHVNAIQLASADSIDAIREMSDMISEINQVASSIAVAVTEQSAATQGISENVQQVAQGTEHASHGIAIVTNATGETGRAADQVLNASRELAEQSQLMREKVDAFLFTVRAA